MFDNNGGGVIYTVLSSATLLLTDHFLSLSNPQPVDMGGIKLTTNAITATMNSVGYILDKVHIFDRALGRLDVGALLSVWH